MKKSLFLVSISFVISSYLFSISPKVKISQSPDELIDIIHSVNNYWQINNSPDKRSFWDEAAYHTGNMAVYQLTHKQEYLNYTLKWAEYNNWKGATSDNKDIWKYSYGEKPEYVLFGDWQICFQTYIDLFQIEKDSSRIKRALEVMDYQIHSNKNDYWWWADGLYMVMPVMTKMYKLTGNQLYLDKLYTYFSYADSIMYDKKEKLYYRDAKYVYPKHSSVNGKKDFWARGDGWVIAALAKVLTDLPANDKHRSFYLSRYKGLANALEKCQQTEGYWTRSLLDPEHAPGYETSGTAFNTYGILWGINNKILSPHKFKPVIEKSWKYLSETALQKDGKIGFVQPIGEKAIPGQVVDINSTANFGVGAYLLAVTELYKNQTLKK